MIRILPRTYLTFQIPIEAVRLRKMLSDRGRDNRSYSPVTFLFDSEYSNNFSIPQKRTWLYYPLSATGIIRDTGEISEVAITLELSKYALANLFGITSLWTLGAMLWNFVGVYYRHWDMSYIIGPTIMIAILYMYHRIVFGIQSRRYTVHLTNVLGSLRR